MEDRRQRTSEWPQTHYDKPTSSMNKQLAMSVKWKTKKIITGGKDSFLCLNMKWTLGCEMKHLLPALLRNVTRSLLVVQRGPQGLLPPRELTETRQGPALLAEALRGNCQSNFQGWECTALMATAEAIWWHHKEDSHAECWCPVSASVHSKAPRSPGQLLSLSLPTFSPSSAFSAYSQWMASHPSWKPFTIWLQPPFHLPLHCITTFLQPYRTHLHPSDTCHSCLMAFVHAVPSASNSLPFNQCLFDFPDQIQ